MTTDKAYKVMTYDRFQMYTDDDCYGCETSFDRLDEAVAHCRQKVDAQIEDDIKRAEAGELTTGEEIKEIVSSASAFGWCFSIVNPDDPATKNAFSYLGHISDRLTEIVERRSAN